MIGVKFSFYQYTLQLPRGVASRLRSVCIRQAPPVQRSRIPQEILAAHFLNDVETAVPTLAIEHILSQELACDWGISCTANTSLARKPLSTRKAETGGAVRRVYTCSTKHTLTHKHGNKSMGPSEKPHGTLKRYFHKT